MFLSAKDVDDILALIDGSAVDELRLQTERFNLLLRRSPDGQWTQQQQQLTEPNLTNQAEIKIDEKTVATTKGNPKSVVAGHLVAVPTPMPGTFYRAPKPGAAAFVEIGDQVKQDTVVAIIETMKLMNSITAKTTGTVVEICFANAEFAEQNSVLMRIAPDK